MKIQFLNGGLANQTFQYIFARYYELSHPGEIMYLDDSYFAINTVHNGYELDKVFNLHPHMLSECFDEDVWEFILEQRKQGKSIPQILCDNGMPISMISEVGDAYKNFNPFNGEVVKVPTNKYTPEILDISNDIYYHGYWINRQWFDKYKDTFIKELSLPKITDEKNIQYLNQIHNTKSLSVHIRRGDYVKLGFSNSPDDYYRYTKTFVDHIHGKWNLFIFSDDIEWCKQNHNAMGFHQFDNVTYVEGNVNGKNYIDLQLMSECKAMIITNSSFCFLAGLLNTQKPITINTVDRDI